jgi:hypothetical protein
VITNTGKGIIAKYMIGQTSAYASYIAVGCGAQPKLTGSTPVDYSSQSSLGFEMFRVPIISRGYIVEDGQSKIVFTAELPTQERYEITEVGIFSAAANQNAGSSDSRNIYSFSDTENWEYHSSTESVQIPTITNPLDGDNNDNIIIGEYDINLTGTLVDCPVIQTNADNRIFTNTNRVERYERSRFLNNMILMRGNVSNLELDVNNFLVPGTGSEHIHLGGVNTEFSKNAPTDELRLAFSLVSKDGESIDIPDSIRIMVDFASSDVSSPDQYARFEVNLSHSSGDPLYDFTENRYFVATNQIQQLHKSSGFTWNGVDIVKIYTTVLVAGVPSEDYYIALDAMRLENVTTTNPVYGLTGYSVIKTDDKLPIVKSPNTSNYIEFRFGLGVE